LVIITSLRYIEEVLKFETLFDG